ncbi:MAG: methionyl-tRNA formyltransferase [Anaerolineae bacterium]
MAKVIFMGTPDFAVPVLEKIIEEHEVLAVVTQPDRPAGRGGRLRPPPVKEFASLHGLPLLQPPALRGEVVKELASLAPEVILVAAYGQILPRSVLGIPPHGCLNVHASLLPRHRGAAPIAAAILAGDEATGITIMLMDEGLDTGPIVSQAECPISPQDTGGSLATKLSHLGAELLSQTLPRWLRGEIEPRPQDESQATYCPMIRKEDGLLDWSRPAVELWRRVRAFHPHPGTYTYWEGKRLKILRTGPLSERRGSEEPGRVLSLPEGLAVATGEGTLLLEEVQPEGKRPMSGVEFARGRRGFIGSRLFAPHHLL